MTNNSFFLLCLGNSSSFVANRIQLNTNTSNITVEEGFLADALVFIRFPPGDISALQFIYKPVSHVKHSQDQQHSPCVSADAGHGGRKPSNTSMGFVLYQSDRFFNSAHYKSKRATVRVLSAKVEGHERSLVPTHVELQFRPAVSVHKGGELGFLLSFSSCLPNTVGRGNLRWMWDP